MFSILNCFQVEFASLDGFKNICYTRLKATSNENSLCQVVKKNIPESIFVSYVKIKKVGIKIKGRGLFFLGIVRIHIDLS